MKKFALACLIVLSAISLSSGAEFDARAAFGVAPGRDLDAAFKKAQKDQKRIFLAVYDPKGDYNDQGLQIKYFTDLEETKKLLKENFIIVLLANTHKDVRPYVGDANIERPRFFVLSHDGKKIKEDKLAQNPEYGLKVTKELVAMP